MSSKADEFDVRDGGAGTAGYGRAAADAGYRGMAGDVDYDLGYGAEGWDTQGFRRPGAEAGGGPRDPGAPLPPTGSLPSPLGSSPGGSLGSPLGSPAGPRRPRGPRGPAGPRRPRRGGTGPAGPAGPLGLRRAAGPGRRGAGLANRNRARVKGSWWRHWTLRKALGVALGIVGGFIILGAIAVVVAYEETPVPDAAMAAASFSQSVVYSSNGTLIGRFGTTNRVMLTASQIPSDVVDAVLAAEDRNFYNEGGISPTGIIRAAYTDLTGGNLQGGSTITQQFVRQYYVGIGTQQTLSRKIKEIFVAMKVAKEKSKQWILTNYLNTIYLGDGAYGFEAAAETYYGRHASQLSVAQAAVIAAMIQQPSTYPLPQYRAQLVARWHYVLSGMVQMGTLSQAKAQQLKFPVPGGHVAQSVGRDVWDPYILNMVYNELQDVYHFSQSQIYNGGYTIRTSIDDAKMAALYKAVISNEAQMDQSSSDPFNPTYMHAGAVLENPANGAIEALYPGPGYPGAKYNGIGKVITESYCKKINCEVNMAVYNREQVGSSFKPYVLSTAVQEGMNVQTSTLNGFDNLCIAPDSQATTYSTPASPGCKNGWYLVHNDSTSENGPYNPQMAMAVSINTAYADLWHRVAGPHGVNVVDMAQAFGVNTDAAGITAGPMMEDQAGVALGQASLTVGEQATMLATIDDNGIYHDAHVITSITQNNAPPVQLKITSHPVFSSDPAMNAEEASQVQYAMSKDDTSFGTAPVAAMSNGQEIIAKTGTTNTAQSAFFIGAIPSQALAVALFTDEQGSAKLAPGIQTLDNLGGNSGGGFGGTWPATIWHTYAEAKFVPLGIEQFPAPVFTGSPWNQVPPNLRKAPAKHKKHGRGQFGFPGGNGGNPSPFPTFSCDPQLVSCGAFGLPVTGLLIRRRRRRGRAAP